jgi:hypothetical protein
MPLSYLNRLSIKKHFDKVSNMCSLSSYRTEGVMPEFTLGLNHTLLAMWEELGMSRLWISGGSAHHRIQRLIHQEVH